jgi:hypothetical protein
VASTQEEADHVRIEVVFCVWPLAVAEGVVPPIFELP